MSDSDHHHAAASRPKRSSHVWRGPSPGLARSSVSADYRPDGRGPSPRPRFVLSYVGAFHDPSPIGPDRRRRTRAVGGRLVNELNGLPASPSRPRGPSMPRRLGRSP